MHFLVLMHLPGFLFFNNFQDLAYLYSQVNFHCSRQTTMINSSLCSYKHLHGIIHLSFIFRPVPIQPIMLCFSEGILTAQTSCTNISVLHYLFVTQATSKVNIFVKELSQAAPLQAVTQGFRLLLPCGASLFNIWFQDCHRKRREHEEPTLVV